MRNELTTVRVLLQEYVQVRLLSATVMDHSRFVQRNDEDNTSQTAPRSSRTSVLAPMHCSHSIIRPPDTRNDPWDTHTCRQAAKYGHVQLLQWAKAEECPWDQLVCTYLARRGDLTTLKWARSKKCPWDSCTCSKAAAHGHICAFCSGKEGVDVSGMR